MRHLGILASVLHLWTSLALECPADIQGINAGPITAITALVGPKDHVEGVVTMFQAAPDEKVVVDGTVTGLPPGKHGIHISQSGDMTGGCYVSGQHYNPLNASHHGAPTDKIRHVADLGNIVADEDGNAKFHFTDPVLSLYPTNPAFVIGRVLLVHETFDDLGRGENPPSLLNGNAGGRLACGVIGYK
ncbi:putative Superoxide dismutase (Cu-Zn) [Hypsibius exemplaris]|uniref:Superoxide dismutase [Cu-Zn] n=1 Tax=Hypsibius exemplaris TaxID=2072580 RepID=A0A1W0WMM0_HYPEX|nr:putative Superoxide dismutase (Cu-Zn) [Hypsibius exemplaris]